MSVPLHRPVTAFVLGRLKRRSFVLATLACAVLVTLTEVLARRWLHLNVTLPRAADMLNPSAVTQDELLTALLNLLHVTLTDALLNLPLTLLISVPRLHDAGRSGRWALLAALPVLGPLALLTLCLRGSEPGDNRWGPSPGP